MLTCSISLFLLYFFVYFVECIHSKTKWEQDCAYWSMFWILLCVFLIVFVNNGFSFVQVTVTFPYVGHHD